MPIRLEASNASKTLRDQISLETWPPWLPSFRNWNHLSIFTQSFHPKTAPCIRPVQRMDVAIETMHLLVASQNIPVSVRIGAKLGQKKVFWVFLYIIQKTDFAIEKMHLLVASQNIPVSTRIGPKLGQEKVFAVFLHDPGIHQPKLFPEGGCLERKFYFLKSKKQANKNVP